MSPARDGPRAIRSSVSIALLGPADASALLDLRAANRAFLEPWEPSRGEAWFTVDAQLADVRRSMEMAREDRGYHFGIWFQDRLAGRIALNDVVRGVFQNAHLGYFVAEDLGRRGIATEATRQILEYAFLQLGLHRVQAAVIPGNAASLRVLEKAGFRTEGLALRYLEISGAWRDHHILAITREEWPAGRP